MSKLDIILDNTNYIRVSNARLTSDDSTPTISTAQAELRNTAGGSAITDSAITLTQVSGKDDEYEGQFPDSVSLTAGDEIWVWVKLTDNQSPANVGIREKPVTVTRH